MVKAPPLKQLISARKKTATGYIVAVQEQRFRLMTDTGETLLLTLAHNARVEGSSLAQLHFLQAHVAVEYEGQSNAVSGVASAVRSLEAPPRAGRNRR